MVEYEIFLYIKKNTKMCGVSKYTYTLYVHIRIYMYIQILVHYVNVWNCFLYECVEYLNMYIYTYMYIYVYIYVYVHICIRLSYFKYHLSLFEYQYT